MNGYDWSSINCSDVDVDVRLEQLSANIMKALDKVAPVKEFRPKKKFNHRGLTQNLKSCTTSAMPYAEDIFAGEIKIFVRNLNLSLT